MLPTPPRPPVVAYPPDSEMALEFAHFPTEGEFDLPLPLPGSPRRFRLVDVRRTGADKGEGEAVVAYIRRQQAAKRDEAHAASVITERARQLEAIAIARLQGFDDGMREGRRLRRWDIVTFIATSIAIGATTLAVLSPTLVAHGWPL
jgi:hypothetical protein